MHEVKHEYHEVNGIKLHIGRKGNGKKLVVLLHGWPEFWYTWRYQIPVLANYYTVVAPDLRGFNLSDKPIGIEQYKTDIVATDIAELIKKLGFEKAHIIGHDWGGATAWTFAALYPELTDKLVVLNCPHPKVMLKSLKSNPVQIFRSWYMFYHQIPLLPEYLYDNVLPLFFKQFFRGWMYNKQNFSDADLKAFVLAFRQTGALTGGLNYYRAMMQTKPNTSIFRNKIAADTLLIWGEGDRALGKELTNNTEDYIAGDFQLNFIQNCSHWTQNDCPDEVNNQLLAFLDVE